MSERRANTAINDIRPVINGTTLFEVELSLKQ